MEITATDIYRSVEELEKIIEEISLNTKDLIKEVKAERKVTNWNEVIGVETNLDHLMQELNMHVSYAVTDIRSLDNNLGLYIEEVEEKLL